MALGLKSIKSKFGKKSQTMVKRAPSSVSSVSSGKTEEIVRPDFDPDRGLPMTRMPPAGAATRRPSMYEGRSRGYNGMYPGSVFSRPSRRSVFDPFDPLWGDPLANMMGAMTGPRFAFTRPSMWDSHHFSHFGLDPSFDMGHSSFSRPSGPERAGKGPAKMITRNFHMSESRSTPGNMPKRTYWQSKGTFTPEQGWKAQTRRGDDSGWQPWESSQSHADHILGPGDYDPVDRFDSLLAGSLLAMRPPIWA